MAYLEKLKVCPKCGAQNALDHDQCVRCGANCKQDSRESAATQASSEKKRKPSSLILVTLALMLTMTALPSFLYSLDSLAAVRENWAEVQAKAAVDPDISGKWYYCDSSEYVTLQQTDDADVYAVDNDRLSFSIFGNIGADITISNIVHHAASYSTADLTAALDGKKVHFDVYFNNKLLTIENPDFGRITLCDDYYAEKASLANKLINEYWGTEDFSFILDENHVGRLFLCEDRYDFEWTVQGRYLTMYIPESNTYIVWYAEIDFNGDGRLTLERFQKSSSPDTADVVWTSIKLK